MTTSLKEFGIPSSCSSIMYPAMAHKWRIMIADRKLLMMQATRVQIDMLNDKITVWIEQPAQFAQDMLDDIRSLRGRSPLNINIQLLDGVENVLGKIGGFAEMKEHKFVLDYGHTGVATHELTFSYTPPA